MKETGTKLSTTGNSLSPPAEPFYRKKEKPMAMKNEARKHTIWDEVRSDVDVDDLIFNYEAYHKKGQDANVQQR